jgi:hypothetical protein
MPDICAIYNSYADNVETPYLVRTFLEKGRPGISLLP